ncbi:hypothetical protein [Fluviicola taffensis]|uniref:Outer membrane protein beta-barrel domain-containing protein n=1 Tax=Fluviicola taffensis (strain DSM 16823 / NCIMB 13979 / RW262) TaxID=755732 RepID=F2IDR2_FLUTR|nr:hypothetical protein [Fluviicola taffensis]AEA44454.1 hypothetical protein Fluta_2469 [Fluviicola taffensis DSM 16823]
MKELDEIDQLFQTTFEEFELTPDPTVKANIDRAIASKKKRRRFLFVLLPILFGSTLLAATFHFYSFSKETKNNKHILSQSQFNQNKTIKQSVTTSNLSYSKENKQAKNITKHQETNSSSKPLRKRMSFENNHSSGETKSANDSNNKSKLTSKSNLIFPNVSELGSSQTNPQNVSSNAVVRQAENQTKSVLKENALTEIKRDSITTYLLVDSIKDNIAETPPRSSLTKEIKENPRKWSLSLVSGWENEAKKRSERFDSTTFSGNPIEFAQIHASTFYGKIELNRKLNTRFDAIIGLGFRSSKVKQIGSLYSLDSFVVFEGVSSTPVPDSMGYFIKNQRETRTYHVNSIIVPLGISFSLPMSKNFDVRISGGTEFAYGWKTTNKIASVLSPPKFRPFGWNIWFRPELHYTFGKLQLVGFGSFNQTLIQQLNWDFKVRRNPSFGAGIGILINL